jgi:hypothetical protein
MLVHRKWRGLDALRTHGKVEAINPMNAPKALSIEEWKEIMQVPAVKESWGLSGRETPEEFADMAYGVKFDFTPMTGPEYVGDLYILSGDAIGEPFTLIRKNNRLVIV